MKKIFISLLFCFSLNLMASTGVEIQNPTIRFTVPGMKVTAAFLKIVNKTDKDFKIIKVTGDFAQTFEMHTMEMSDGKMKMRAVDFIELKKKSTTELKPGGLHIMIFDVTKPLAEKETHKFRLVLDNKDEIEVNAIVTK